MRKGFTRASLVITTEHLVELTDGVVVRNHQLPATNKSSGCSLIGALIGCIPATALVDF